ncbi:hypothetical protein CEXT_415651 [Caerostris extrusa]|uniref:Uncharacterized protein n=1 Tax=Caerostris extrusa TaxID=172846 RepID=A0AAV4STX0_CAEEX|nr:hypothetical protein CEXT_415651 [Caerostris extrusa]
MLSIGSVSDLKMLVMEVPQVCRWIASSNFLRHHPATRVGVTDGGGQRREGGAAPFVRNSLESRRSEEVSADVDNNVDFYLIGHLGWQCQEHVSCWKK